MVMGNLGGAIRKGHRERGWKSTGMLKRYGLDEKSLHVRNREQIRTKIPGCRGENYQSLQSPVTHSTRDSYQIKQLKRGLGGKTDVTL